MIAEVLPVLRPPEGLLEGPPWSPATVWVAALAGMTCLGVGGIAWRQRHPRGRRETTPQARARDALANLAAEGAGPVDLFEVSCVFRHFLRAVCGEGRGERTAAEWERHLRGCSGLDSDWVAEVVGFLSACEAQRFGSLAATPSGGWVATAQRLVDRWGATARVSGREEGSR